MSLRWTDGNFAVASAVSGIRASCPIPGINVEYLIEQDFVQFKANFAALALDTAHATETDFKLVEETPREDQGGGIVKWTRRHAKVPSQHNEWETIAYNFIGFWGATGTVTVTGRDRFTKVVPCRVQHDYFLCAAGQTYTTPGDIPILQAQTYIYGADPDTGLLTDWLSDAPPFTAASTPSRTDYEGWLANAHAHGWACDPVTDESPTDPGQIVAETSRLSRWLGNIWLRQTRFILAE